MFLYIKTNILRGYGIFKNDFAHPREPAIIASIIGVEVAGGASLMYRHRQMGRDSTSAQHLAWFL